MFLQALISGVYNGALYALIALGFVVIFNVSGWLNFPQGQFMFIGAFLTLTFLSLNLPMPAAVILAIMATTIIGVLFERLTLGRMRQPGFAVAVMIMVGGSFLFDGIMMVSFGKALRAFPPFIEKWSVGFFGAAVPTQALVLIGITIILGVALWYFFNRQLYGKAMRATSQNPMASRLVGINTQAMVVLSFVLSASMGALSGIIIAPLTYVVYNAGLTFAMKGFVAAVIGGGLVSYPGAFLGGLLVGIIESYTTVYVTSLFKDAVLFAILIIVLVLRPTGLLGPRQQT